jgi:hypothetical protein
MFWTPSDLMTFAQSPFASWMDRLERDCPSHPWLILGATEVDPMINLLSAKGSATELEFLSKGMYACMNLTYCQRSCASKVDLRVSPI